MPKLFSFEGRLSRSQFWSIMAPIMIAGVFMYFLEKHLNRTGHHDVAATLKWLFLLVVIIPIYAAEIRRFHDRGKSGWWVLIKFIPIIGWIWLFVELGCLPGTPRSNNRPAYQGRL